MTHVERMRLATQFQAKGRDAGVHPEHGVVLYYADRIWRVAGGDLNSPSMICLAGVRLGDVHWLWTRFRKEPVA